MTPARAETHEDTIRSQTLYISTMILCKDPCGTSVSRLPLAYKRRRRSPGRRGRTFHSHSPHTCSPDIGTCLNHLAGTWRLFLLSRACSPPSTGTIVHCNTTHKRNLLDVRPRDRNQDKPVSPYCLAPATEGPITTHFTSWCRD
jgi:hypothetical protein